MPSRMLPRVPSSSPSPSLPSLSGSHFLRRYRLTPLSCSISASRPTPSTPRSSSASSLHTSEHKLGNAPYAHMHTRTREASHCLTWKAPAVIGQSGHVQLHIPGERKVIGHLEPDAQPNAALCCPEQNQFCWQDGTQLLGQPTGFPTDRDPLPLSFPQQRVLSFRSSR